VRAHRPGARRKHQAALAAGRPAGASHANRHRVPGSRTPPGVWLPRRRTAPARRCCRRGRMRGRRRTARRRPPAAAAPPTRPARGTRRARPAQRARARRRPAAAPAAAPGPARAATRLTPRPAPRGVLLARPASCERRRVRTQHKRSTCAEPGARKQMQCAAASRARLAPAHEQGMQCRPALYQP